VDAGRPNACPDCETSARAERLDDGWWFCAACGLAWRHGADGNIARALTSHSPRAKEVVLAAASGRAALGTAPPPKGRAAGD